MTRRKDKPPLFWAVRMTSSDGPQYHGPFPNPSEAVTWADAAEKEAGYQRAWVLVPLRYPR